MYGETGLEEMGHPGHILGQTTGCLLSATMIHTTVGQTKAEPGGTICHNTVNNTLNTAQTFSGDKSPLI